MVLEAKQSGESTHMGRGWDRTPELSKYMRMRANVLNAGEKIYKYKERKAEYTLSC